MDSSAEPIRQDIENIRSSMTEKMEQIEHKIKGTVDDTTDSVKRMVDVKYQIAEHPWAAVGVSVVAGYVLGSMGDQPSHRYENGSEPGYARPATAAAAYAQARGSAPHEAGMPSTASYEPAGAAWRSEAMGSNGGTRYSAPPPSPKPHLLDDLSRQFGDELETLKGVAVTSLIGLIRDTLRTSFPNVYAEMERARRATGVPPAAERTPYASATEQTHAAPYRQSNSAPSDHGPERRSL